MLSYEIANSLDHDLVIDGLGVVPRNGTKEFSSDEADWFRTLRGVQLLPTNLPEGATLTAVVRGDK